MEQRWYLDCGVSYTLRPTDNMSFVKGVGEIPPVVAPLLGVVLFPEDKIVNKKR